MYDEWLAEEKATKAQQREAMLHSQAQAQAQQAQVQASLGLGDTAPSAQSGTSTTIRAVTPDKRHKAAAQRAVSIPA